MRPLLLTIALAFATAAWAQSKPAPKEPAKPAAQAEKPAAEKPAEKPAQAAEKPAPVKKASSRRNEDARHCLEKGSNTEIIKCAEAYL